jgi:hypothetical protein
MAIENASQSLLFIAPSGSPYNHHECPFFWKFSMRVRARNERLLSAVPAFHYI